MAMVNTGFGAYFRAFWKEFKLNDNAFSSEEFYIFIVLTILAIIINASLYDLV